MSGVYVHVPFCRQSCIYCNFYFRNGNRQSAELTEALLKEIDLKINRDSFKLETLYFGGGTPSFVEPSLIKSIIDRLVSVSDASALSEVTLEANPDDVSMDKLRQWKEMGINRLSMGVQSFFDRHLEWMNRAHNASQADFAIRAAKDMGFELSIDLIFGIPGSTAEEWAFNLEKAVSYDIQHLSCYGLTLEDNTPWKKLVSTRQYPLPSDELASEQFTYAMEFLSENGWVHYEISNYCRPGFVARHNTSYWQGKPYTGLGPSAHSFDGGSRSWNIADINAYVSALNAGNLPEEREILGVREKYNEYVMTGLRTIWGVDLATLNAFGTGTAEFLDKAEQYVAQGKMRREGEKFTLTNEGRLYADAIASSLFI
jgi:oxygen-independent coproporphyrinogen-3 oxidase